MLSSLNNEDRLIGLSIVLTLGGISLGSAFEEPRFLGYTALLGITILILGWVLTKSARLAWLLIFGCVAGLLELWADWLHVTHLGSLVYTDYFGFPVLASPSYMPAGWWLTVVQFGYLALRLSEHWPPWIAIALVTVLGMSLPPWYEEFAASARAWYYPTTGVMISRTPLWVILTYGGCMFSIATMALTFYRPRSLGRAALGGIFAGAGFMFWGVFWFSLVADGLI